MKPLPNPPHKGGLKNPFQNSHKGRKMGNRISLNVGE